MIRPSIVGTIAGKELLESLRDRKTLVLMVLLPILLYPALLLLITQVAMMQAQKLAEEISVVVVEGVGPDHELVGYLDSVEAIDVMSEDEAPFVDAVVRVSDWEATDALGSATIEVSFRSVEETSIQAVDRLELALIDWSDQQMRERLEEAELPESFTAPIVMEFDDTAESSERGGYLLGSLLPAIIIITVMLGAAYPSVDLTAGEKERKTIQTLFTAPVTPLEIVGGKYLAVISVSMITGLANLLSMALVFGQGLALTPLTGDELDFSISFPVVVGLLWCIVLISLLMSAALLAVAALAPSYKEAQVYITPVYLVAIVPGMIAQLPGFELSGTTAFMPAVNVILLMKQLLLDGASAESLFLVSASSLVYAFITLAIAARIFGQEAVMVGDKGSFAILTPRSQLKERPFPSSSDALIWFGIVFAVFYYAGVAVQAWDPVIGLGISLWGLILLPTVLLSTYLKLDLRETFQLRAPSVRAGVGSVLLGGSLWILLSIVNQALEEYVFQTPPEILEEMGRQFMQAFPDTSTVGGVALLFFLFAFSPAICEEALFRGFILSGLRTRMSATTSVFLSALLFGALHLSIHRLFGTAVLGAVMGAMVLNTRSIWTASIFHALNNGGAVLAMIMLGEAADTYQPPVWVYGVALAASALGAWLIFGEASHFVARDKLEATSASHRTS